MSDQDEKENKTEKAQPGKGFWGGIGRMVRGGVEKSKQLGRLGLLKIDLQKAHGERDEAYKHIGRLTVNRLHEPDPAPLEASDTALSHLLGDLARIEVGIADLERQISLIRDGES